MTSPRQKEWEFSERSERTERSERQIEYAQCFRNARLQHFIHASSSRDTVSNVGRCQLIIER